MKKKTQSIENNFLEIIISKNIENKDNFQKSWLGLLRFEKVISFENLENLINLGFLFIYLSIRAHFSEKKHLSFFL